MKLTLRYKDHRLVRGSGSRSSTIAMIGEAPGRDEDREGIPFVGRAGTKQAEEWRRQGMRRQDIYIDNVIQVRPPGNDLAELSDHAIAKWQNDWHKRMLQVHPNVLVVTGNLALNTARRNPIKRGKEKNRVVLKYLDKITSWRGSITEYVDNNGRRIKMIPTIHPAAVDRQAKWEGRWRRDWERIKSDSEYPELRRLECEHYIDPTVEDLYAFYHEAARQAKKLRRDMILAEDIETPGGVMSCISFSYDPKFSLTIPLQEWMWRDRQKLAVAYNIVRLLNQLPCAKLTHGGLFDAFHLRRGPRIPIHIKWWLWDTQELHHCEDSSDEHSLAYCASLDIRVQYWKDEAKEGDGKYGRYSRDTKALHRYCGMDSCYTRALGGVYIQRIRQASKEAFYIAHYRKVRRHLLDMMCEGIPVNERKREKAYARETLKLDVLRSELKELVGVDLVAKTGLSGPKVIKYFYETLRCRSRVKKRSADEVNLRRFIIRYPKARPGGIKILEYRRHKKLQEFFIANRVDPDGRFRSTYKFLTRWGRFSSSKNPMGGGGNAQNIDRTVRDMFVPFQGHVLVEVDAAQGESRLRDIMAYNITKDPFMHKLATASPLELDQHRMHAATIFSKDEVDISEDERDIGKRTNHAVGYGMGGQMMADTVLKETEGRLVLAPEECQEFIDTLLHKLFSIIKWQEEIRSRIINERQLITSWGRVFYFNYSRLDEYTYKEGYSALPQNELVELLNQCGFVPLATRIKVDRMTSRILAQEHDSLVITSPADEVWEVVEFLGRKLQAPRRYWGEELSIPMGVKVGLDWGNMHKWKVIPEKEEFMDAVKEMTK